MQIQTLTREQIRNAQSPSHKEFLEVFYRDIFVDSYAGQPLETIEILESDRNTTGYFDGLVTRNLRQPVGTILRAISNGTRRLLIVVTPVGNVVLFERYVAGEHGALVTNLPNSLRAIIQSGRVDQNTVNMITGGAYMPSYNIGYSLQSVICDAATVNWEADELTGNCDDE